LYLYETGFLSYRLISLGYTKRRQCRGAESPGGLVRQKNINRTISVAVSFSIALSSRMSDETTPRILREIQREIAEIREDRAIMIESLDRLDAAVNRLSAEMKTLRSQFDHFRNEMRERLEEANERPRPQ
jgi:chromosome segregation ATPase